MMTIETGNSGANSIFPCDGFISHEYAAYTKQVIRTGTGTGNRLRTGVRISGREGVRISGRTGVRISGRSGVRISGRAGVRISSLGGVRISGRHRGVRISGSHDSREADSGAGVRISGSTGTGGASERRPVTPRCAERRCAERRRGGWQPLAPAGGTPRPGQSRGAHGDGPNIENDGPPHRSV
ncbi:hypothetical protein SAMN04487904_103210 [Actinopolyspora lacussalsi subsp. righensis]|uniref:Uncharacterized protein n=1 Tax=Actinopolyspora righensis TaxID=995060 RepID=A0A1I6YTV9_9ACTN|nr:hypothetical protein SAMN04487904_103210 [Actinopolyspora righensis]